MISVVSRPERAAGLQDLGVNEVVIGDTPLATPVFAALAVGDGRSVKLAAESVMAGGTLVAIANDAQNDETIANDDYRFIPFGMDGHAGSDLAEPLALMETGQLVPQVDWRGEWSRVQEAIGAVLGRQVARKAVLDIR